MNEARLRFVAANICDIFEDLLDEHDITIPDPEREGNEDEARIYGSTYDKVENKVVAMLKQLMLEQ